MLQNKVIKLQYWPCKSLQTLNQDTVAFGLPGEILQVNLAASGAMTVKSFNGSIKFGSSPTERDFWTIIFCC